VRKIFSLSFLIILFFSFSLSQQNEQPSKRTNQQTNERTTEQPFFNKLLPYFPPTFFEAELRLKHFIRSKRFSSIKKEYGELASIDSIFVRAKFLTNGNLSLALLLSTLATNDHRIIYFRFPIFDFRFPFPLSLESKEEFRQRFQNLPRYFLDPLSDNRDKLQHFFASAFLSYTFESKEMVKRMGMSVEKGEEQFIDGGRFDFEDLAMNKRGALFGERLSRYPESVPSVFIISQRSDNKKP